MRAHYYVAAAIAAWRDCGFAVSRALGARGAGSLRNYDGVHAPPPVVSYPPRSPASFGPVDSPL